MHIGASGSRMKQYLSNCNTEEEKVDCLSANWYISVDKLKKVLSPSMRRSITSWHQSRHHPYTIAVRNDYSEYVCMPGSNCKPDWKLKVESFMYFFYVPHRLMRQRVMVHDMEKDAEDKVRLE